MSGIITTGLFPKRLWPGVKTFYGYDYANLDKEYIFLCSSIEKSDKRYEEVMNIVPLPLPTTKQEGDAIQYNSFKQGVLTRMDNVVYATGFIMTHEVGADDQYDTKLSSIGGKFMASSMLANKEIIVANLFNNGFSTSFPVGDGAAFFSASHNYGGVNFSNLSTAAALSEAAVESMYIDIMNQVNDAGIRMRMKPTSLHVPVALKYSARRLFGGTGGTGGSQRPATADRDVSAIREYKEAIEIHTHRYLSSSTAFFMKTDIPNGTILFEREGIEGGEDNDFDTGNRKFKIMERFVPAVADPRGWQGNAGA